MTGRQQGSLLGRGNSELGCGLASNRGWGGVGGYLGLDVRVHKGLV